MVKAALLVNGECADPGRDGEVPVGIGASWEVWDGAGPGLCASIKNAPWVSLNILKCEYLS